MVIVGVAIVVAGIEAFIWSMSESILLTPAGAEDLGVHGTSVMNGAVGVCGEQWPLDRWWQ